MSEQKPNHNPTFSSFADWCKNKDSLSKEARKTVEALLKDARTSDCNEAERILSSCTELSVYSYRDISDLSPLSTLTNLNKLWISDNQISDLSPLSTLTNLTKLKSGSNQISELSPLSGLTNLTQLGISNNQISDLSPLSTLTNLTELNLYVNQISDLRPLSGLTNLTQLILGHNRISDLSPLSTLTNLTRLCICDNPVTDLSPLSTLINLTSLDIGEDKYDPFGYDFSGQISNLSPLSTLTNLTELNLNDNQISDIRPLSNLTNLTELHLADNQISDLRPLSGLSNLTKLDLANNQISDLSPLSILTNLTELDLSDNQISDIRPLLTLTNLTKLHLGRNPISDLSIAPHEEKWHTLSQKPIDPQKAKEAIKSAYTVIGKAEPEIIFCSSPYAGIPLLQACESLGEPLAKQLSQLTSKLLNPVMWDCLWWLTVFQPGEDIRQQLEQQLEDDGFDTGINYFTPEDPLSTIALTEYCVSKLGCVLDRETQEAFYCLNQLFEHCGWIWAYGKVCIVCDRPTQLLFDNEHRLHAEGQPAIQFSDGYSLYSYHGVTLPEKYGKLHPNNWQSQWILSEENAELRRVLIQGIGYARICQELAAQELDTWREYTLLKIDNDVDVAPVYLLKMTCPSTGHIHALRVPPDMQSAREAIRWVNWGIDPEEFSVQT
jgi:internalin A